MCEVQGAMKLEELAESLGAKVLNPGAAGERPIGRVYAGDRMSDVLSHATDATLVVTNLSTPHLLRAASLMDVPAICLLNGLEPGRELVDAARESGTALLVSPFDLFETCGRLYAALRSERQRRG